MTKKKRLIATETSTEFNLHDVLDVAYYGPAFFGTPMQGNINSNFNYDTGSGFLTVTGKKCKNCYSQYYDHEKSDTSKVGFSDYDNVRSLNYGSATLKGRMYTDDVCLDPESPSTCASQFGFFVFNSQTGADGEDGLLGLGPDNKKTYGPNFIKFLKD